MILGFILCKIPKRTPNLIVPLFQSPNYFMSMIINSNSLRQRISIFYAETERECHEIHRTGYLTFYRLSINKLAGLAEVG